MFLYPRAAERYHGNIAGVVWQMKKVFNPKHFLFILQIMEAV